MPEPIVFVLIAVYVWGWVGALVAAAGIARNDAPKLAIFVLVAMWPVIACMAVGAASFRCLHAAVVDRDKEAT